MDRLRHDTRPDRTVRQIFLPVTDDYGLYVDHATRRFARRSPYQEVAIYDTVPFGRMLCLDQYVMVTEKDEAYYHEPLVHVPAFTHPHPRSALIIGGGDGGSAREVRRHRSIEHILVVEIDSEVVEASRLHLTGIHQGALYDRRVEVLIGDGLRFVQGTDRRFDLIILDLTDPLGPSRPLYSADFYRACSRLMRPGAIMSLHIESPTSRPDVCRQIVENLRAAFAKVAPYVTTIPTYGALWGMATASQTLDPRDVFSRTIAYRLTDPNFAELKVYNPFLHQAMFALPNEVAGMLEGTG